MARVREIQVPFDELTAVAIRCTECHAQTIVDVADEKQSRAWTQGDVVRCDICQTPISAGLKVALTRFRDWYELAKKSG